MASVVREGQLGLSDKLFAFSEFRLTYNILLQSILIKEELCYKYYYVYHETF